MTPVMTCSDGVGVGLSIRRQMCIIAGWPSSHWRQCTTWPSSLDAQYYPISRLTIAPSGSHIGLRVKYQDKNPAVWITLDYACDLVYILDSAVRFRTSKYDGLLENDSLSWLSAYVSWCISTAWSELTAYSLLRLFYVNRRHKHDFPVFQISQRL